MSQVEVRVMGPFEVLVDSEPVEVAAGRASALLATLALSAGRTVSIEQLTDAVWGDQLPANARRTVQTNIKRLRATLGRDVIQGQTAGYRLDIATTNVDALAFLEQLDAANAEPAAERERLVTALQLWRGSPFTGLHAPRLVESEGPRLLERRLSALERRMDLDLAAGQAAAVVSEARQLTRDHPLRETTWARLLIALHRTGRTAEALECFEEVRTRIADGLGVDPGPELRRIHAELLRGETSEPDTTSSDRPPAEPPVPRQLPADIRPFTGRADALAALDDLLDEHDDSGRAVVALHGPGGTGKTTLAVHWGHRVTDRFPDGQVYVNLQGFGPGAPVSPTDALEGLLRALGVSSEQLPDKASARGALLRTILADRRALMILDNARDVEQVRPLLPGSGGTFVMVTSRRQLRGLAAREGASRVPVDTLPLDDATDLVAAGLDRAGIPHEPATRVVLAELCGCLPLALAVAVERAGRYPDSELTDLVDELRAEHERLDALDTGDDPLTNIRAVLSWSYQALDDDSARLFRLLGLHLGSDVSLPAAAALAGTPTRQARRLLDRLIELHLVEHRQPGRYAMHDLVRSYAAELAEESETPTNRDHAIRRLLSWYLHSAYLANVQLRFGRDGSRSIDVGGPEAGIEPATFASFHQARSWFDTEWPTLTRVIGYAADHGHPGVAFRIVSKSFEYLSQNRPPTDAIELQRIGARAAAAAGNRIAEGFLTSQLGISQGRHGDLEEHVRQLERASELFRAEGHLGGEEIALSNLGSAYRSVGRLDDARRSLVRALELVHQQGGDDTAGILINLARVHVDGGRPHDAFEPAHEAVDQAGVIGNRRAEAIALETLGLAHAAIGSHAAAEGCLGSALEINRDLAYRGDEAIVLAHLGRVQRDTGRLEAARSTWQLALVILDEEGEADAAELTRDQLVELIDGLGDA